jgi:hypothetical protein
VFRIGGGYVGLPEDFDLLQPYVVRVAGLRDSGLKKQHDKYKEQAAAGIPEERMVGVPHNIVWTFELFHMDGSPVMDAEEAAYRHRENTSDATSLRGQQPAKAGTWILALTGRDPETFSSSGELERAVIGSTGLVRFDQKTTMVNGAPRTYTNIISLGQPKDRSKMPKLPPPQVVGAGVPSQPDAYIDEPEDLPF